MTDSANDPLRTLKKVVGRSHPDLRTTVIEACRHATEKKSADLVYEMARACLAEVEGARELCAVVPEPEPVQRSRQHLATCVRRLGVEIDDRLPFAHPTPEAALESARHCIQTLEAIEPGSFRSLVLKSQLAFESSPDDGITSENLMREALSRPASTALERDCAQKHLLRALTRQNRHAEVHDLATLALAQAPRDRWLRFYRMQAAGLMGKADLFDAACRSFVETPPDPEGRAWWSGVVRRESASIAEALHRPFDAVLTQMGVEP